MSTRKCNYPGRKLTPNVHCDQHTGESCPDDQCIIFSMISVFPGGKLPRNKHKSHHLSTCLVIRLKKLSVRHRTPYLAGILNLLKQIILLMKALPSMTNLVRMKEYMETMALSTIADGVMCSDQSSVTYSHDGSSQNKVGGYFVQSLTVNGAQRALPPLSIVSESHETLKELQITALRLLSASSGYSYSERELLERLIL